jgi:hypothetical protein
MWADFFLGTTEEERHSIADIKGLLKEGKELRKVLVE